MSVSQNYPSIKPSLSLDFANVKALDPRITFARASTGAYYDGQTVAKAEENLLSYSQEFDNGAWIPANATINANSTAAPDGSSTAETLTGNGTSNQHLVQQQITVVSGQDYAFSFFAKANTNDFVQLRFGGGFGSPTANFDLSAGTVGTTTGTITAAIEDADNGWYRCSGVTDSTSSGLTAVQIYLVTSASAAAAETNSLSTSVYLWGAQLEQRSAVTAYTPTTTQPITNYIPVLETASANVARFDHNPVTGESLGLLVEEQRTNLLTYSEQFDNAAWTKTRSSIASNTIVAPDGTLTGDKLVEDTTASNAHYMRGATTLTANATYTISIFAKAGERAGFNLRTFTSLGWSEDLTASFDLLNGTASGGEIEAVGNGWYRCSLAATKDGTTGTAQFDVRIASGGTEIYTGDGYSGIFIWGAQLEAGAFPTSYIPTVASQVTRSVDSASMTGANFSEWYSAGEGSFYHELNTPNDFAAFANLGVSDGSTSNQIGVQLSSTNQIRGIVKVNNTSSFAANLGSIPFGFYKVAMSYQFNNAAIVLNGGTAATDTSIDVPLNMNQMIISGQGNSINGHIRKLSYYPQRISDVQLQGLTS